MTTIDKEWYNNLKKSPLTPPNIVFPVVWTIIYITIAISAGLIIWKGGLKNKSAILFFIVQLLLNLAWSPVFFRMRMIGPSFTIIILMWLFIILTIYEFNKIYTLASYILIPYLIWVSFAMYLNGYIYFYN